MEAVDRVNLERIESFFNTSSYRESLEGGATFNTRLSIDRRSRLPFLDPQTGVAQRPCALYVKAKQRMPGLKHGQMYSFPAQRWRKTKRQYLTNMRTDFRSALHYPQQQQQPLFTPSSLLNGGGGSSSGAVAVAGNGGAMSGGFLLLQQDENSNSNASFLLDKPLTGENSLLDASVDTNSRDTNNNSKDELSKDWIYDDLDNDFDSEPKSPDDEYDYDPRYGTKKKKKAPKKEAKAKKAASSFGFDFGSASATKTRRSKEAGTPKKAPESGSGTGTERRTRRKGAGAKGKKFLDPPSFETAAAGFDDQMASYGGGWM